LVAEQTIDNHFSMSREVQYFKVVAQKLCQPSLGWDLYSLIQQSS
jgi:hypothetical protein